MEKQTNRREFFKTGAALSAGLALTGMGCNVDQSGDSSNFFEVVQTRRSVRQYEPTSVPEKDIRKILEMAKLCPTAGNRQPWKFVVMQDRTIIQKMRDIVVDNRIKERNKDRSLNEDELMEQRQKINANLAGYFSAPVFIGVLTDNEARFAESMNKHDGPIVAGYICLVAKALGYGTVYLTGSIPAPAFRAAAKVPKRYDICCVICLGIPTSWPEMPSKKSLDQMLVFDQF